ncbi:FAD-dependent oxidoreductase [Spirosoma endbachense]|nr:NAD(P)/FAD-dependent oxidoreductase [Spirosoma endbachense]
MHVLIIGGGIGGLCLAQGLVKTGIDVSVYERNAETSETLAGYGIHLTPLGMKALRACLPETTFAQLDALAGHAGATLRFSDEHLHLLAERDDAQLTGKPLAQVERRDVDRIEFRKLLLQGLSQTSSTKKGVVHWNKPFTHYEQLPDGQVRAFFADGSQATGDLLVGADASNSRVRKQYLPSLERVDTGVLNIAGRYMLTPEREAALPATLIDGSINNIVAPARQWMFVAAWHTPTTEPDKPGFHSTQKYLVWAYVAQRHSYPTNIEQFEPEQLRDLVLARTTDWHADLRVIVSEGDLATLRPIPFKSMPHLDPWPPSPVTLLGDAIHNMTPMAGAGANTALLDAQTLCQCLGEVQAEQRTLVKAVGEYERQMRAYANQAVGLSFSNAQHAASDGPWKRGTFRTLLRLAQALPPVKRLLFPESTV